MKKRTTFVAIMMALLMLAGCSPSVNPSETTDGQTNAPTTNDTTDTGAETEPLPPPLVDNTVPLPYTVSTTRQAGDTVFTGNEWTGKLLPDVDGNTVRQTEIFSANSMAYH